MKLGSAAVLCAAIAAAAVLGTAGDADAALSVTAICSSSDTATISWTGQPMNAHAYQVDFSPRIGNPMYIYETSVSVNVVTGVDYSAIVDVYNSSNVRIDMATSATFRCENYPQVTAASFTPSGPPTTQVSLGSPDSNDVISHPFTDPRASFSGQFTFNLTWVVDKATFAGKEATGNSVVFPNVRIDTGCKYRPLVLTVGDETWTVHTLISQWPNAREAFPACDTLPGVLKLTGARVKSGGSFEEILPTDEHGITDRPIRVDGTGERVGVGISLFAPGYTNLRLDGEDGIGNVFKSFSLDEGCHRFDVDISHGSSSVRKDLYVMVSPGGTGACPDAFEISATCNSGTEATISWKNPPEGAHSYRIIVWRDPGSVEHTQNAKVQSGINSISSNGPGTMLEPGQAYRPEMVILRADGTKIDNTRIGEPFTCHNTDGQTTPPSRSGGQTSTPTTTPSRSGGGGGGSGGTGGVGFFIPPSFFAPSTSAPSTQSEPEPEPLPILNGTIPRLRMISIPHMDMWNGTTITPFQCNVTEGGYVNLEPMYDGMELIHGTFNATDSVTGETWEAPLDTTTPTNATATYNVTVHTTATYNATQIRPYTVMLDVHAGGLEWRIHDDSLAAFQNIFDTVDVLTRYQYGAVAWTAQGGSCQMPQTP